MAPPPSPTGAEAVASISDWEEFFLQQNPPETPGILENEVVTTSERDYDGGDRYNRGHLFPSCHGNDLEAKINQPSH